MTIEALNIVTYIFALTVIYTVHDIIGFRFLHVWYFALVQAVLLAGLDDMRVSRVFQVIGVV